LLYLSSLHLTNNFYLFLGSMFVITMLQPRNSNPHPNDDTRCVPRHERPSTCLPASRAPAREVDCRWGLGRRRRRLRHEHGRRQHQRTTPTPVGNTNTNTNASANGRRDANDSGRHQCQRMTPTPAPRPMTRDNATPPLPHHHSPPSLKREMEGAILFYFVLTEPSQRVQPREPALAGWTSFSFFFSFFFVTLLLYYKLIYH
jgi:hypothetical protein